jgi:Transmembrane protein 43
MYQWKEEKKGDTQTNVGGGTTTTTTYDYTRVWSHDPINSSEFKHPENHDNPEMPFRNAQFAANDAKLGGWPLDADVLRRVTLTNALTPDAPAGWKLSGENYYRGDPAAPKVGDMRVRYVSLPSGSMISVLAKQSGNGFTALTAKNGYEVELAAVGNHSAAELIEGKRKSEAILTWILRAVGTGVMFLGFAMFLAPLSTVASVIPILGDLVGGATALVSLVIAVPVSILVITFA